MAGTGFDGLSGPLLRSGRRGDYNALGEVGQPVFRVATQLREALKRKLGRVDGDAGLLYADHFALPKTDQLGDTIDWYAAFSGDVISWESATEEERDVALGYLRNLEERLTTYRESSEKWQMKGSGHQHYQDAQVFVKLLSKVLYTPDANYVYLVNGFPVLSFWGFTHPKEKLPQDPFQPLFPAPEPVLTPVVVPVSGNPKKPVVSSAISPVAANEKAAGRSWWRYLLWLLLLLLLLWLLFFGLRSCSPMVANKLGLPALSFNRDSLPVNKYPAPSLHDTKDAGLVTVNPDYVGINKGVSSVERTMESGLVPAALLGPETEKLENGMVEADKLNAMAEGAVEQDSGVPASGAGTENNMALPDLPEEGTGSLSGMTPPPLLPSDPSLAGVQPPLIAQDSASQPTVSSQDLVLPAVAPDGPARFLNGTWKAGSGIQDKRTGKPLSIEYEFNQGNGKVAVQNANGVQCSGDASAKMENGRLHIDSQVLSVCADGSSFEMPEIVCAPGATSAADCIGKYENASFPINMRNENE